MAFSVFPAASSGGIKSVQRGSTSVAGTITISAVDVDKTYVNSYGTAASGSAPGAGSSATSYPLRSNAISGTGGASSGGSWTAGTTTLSTKVFGASLTNSTTLTATGACRYEVVEML